MLDRATGGRGETRCTPTESGPTQALGLNVGSDDPHVLQKPKFYLSSGSRTTTPGLRRHEGRSRPASSATVAALTVVDRDKFLGLLGRLNFAATFYPRGRQWLHAPWRAVRAQYRTAADQVVISKAVRERLRLWVTELGQPDHEGVPIGAAEAFPAAASPEVSAIYADAALDCAGAGFCAWTVDGDELLYVQGEWSSAEREVYLICDLELGRGPAGRSRRTHHAAPTRPPVCVRGSRTRPTLGGVSCRIRRRSRATSYQEWAKG
jgi:hypothetical protein